MAGLGRRFGDGGSRDTGGDQRDYLRLYRSEAEKKTGGRVRETAEIESQRKTEEKLMPRIIAGTYEIQEQIGAGGGGIVYVGRHLRLDKKIVLKADKRSLNTDQEELRREVTMLKNLSHTYIPQVYDFVQEDGVVYTVMDFIEGESLDKILERGRKLPQSKVILWACQLLDALVYLHSRSPHGILHGDIKPANIMLRPDESICLIDYNIALALGEDGAVKVGFSRGYASPEHYGIEYAGQRERTTPLLPVMEKTEILCMDADGTGMLSDGNESEVTETFGPGSQRETTEALPEADRKADSPVKQHSTGSTTSRGMVLLDARSDIYSLGATLYHLISGQKPAVNAREVCPLGPDICSPQVSEIIRKAMEPNPNMRYQSAEEMLDAFKNLHKRDRRVIRHKQRMLITAAALAAVFLVGSAAVMTGLDQKEQIQEAMTLSEYSANKLAEGDVTGAVEQALQALSISEKKGIFEIPAPARAQKALTDALGVYDLTEGYKPSDTIRLPSAPFSIEVSPDGTYFAAVYQHELAVFELESGQSVAVLPVQDSALSEVVFVDEARIVYAGEQGVTAYDLESKRVLWVGEPATTLAVSGDKSTVAAVNRDEERAVIYKLSDGTKVGERSFEGLHMAVAANDIFANPGGRIFCLNEEGKLLAVSFSDGSLLIYDLEDPDEDMYIYETSPYEYFEGGFSGNYFAFSANKSDQSLFGLVDAKEGIYIGEMESGDRFYVTAEAGGIYLANAGLLTKLDPDTLEEIELAYFPEDRITKFYVSDSYVITATENGLVSFFDSGANLMSSENYGAGSDFVGLAGNYGITANRTEPAVRLFYRENHDDALVLPYDARYIHDEARISKDGQTAMLFGYRGFRIYDMDGNILAETELPDTELIYDQQFRKEEEGSWLEVIWYDGTVRHYDAASGTVISEEKGEPPQKDLYEEFVTDRYKITSPLHGVPEVYELSSEKKIGELEEDAYLTYVSQINEYLITEYVAASGERYGYLLDQNLQKLAYLPGLCDTMEEQLIFDYGSGKLLQSRLYSLEELKELGGIYMTRGEKISGRRMSIPVEICDRFTLHHSPHRDYN